MYQWMKEIFDRIIAAFLLVLLAPVFLILAIRIKKETKGTIFFKQKRMGKNQEQFELFKFRTMVMEAEKLKEKFTVEQKREYEENFKLENDFRVTQVGAELRKKKLDELPQLLNILKGDMSFVGPRPIVKEELEKYQEQKQKLLSVKPGLTGYWQAYATKDTNYVERMKMEMYYVENRSIYFDLKIIKKTIKNFKKQVEIHDYKEIKNKKLLVENNKK